MSDHPSLAWYTAQLDADERKAIQALTGVPRLLTGEPPPNVRWYARYHRVIQQDPDRLTAAVLVADCGPANVYPAQHIAAHEPARVLRQVAAMRLIVEDYVAWRRRVDADLAEAGLTVMDPPEEWAWRERTIRLLASVFADRAGYRGEWRP